MGELEMDKEEYPGAFFLASLMTSYPDEKFEESTKLLLEDDLANRRLDRVCGDAWANMKGYLGEILVDPEALRDLRGLYVDIFERSRPMNSLYETEYGLGRSVAKGPELLDIATFYKSFGFELGQDSSSLEMVDHLAVELEFYGLMAMKVEALKADGDKEGYEIVDNARKKFLENHLGGFTSSLLSRPGVAGNTFYFNAIKCVDALICAECEKLGIEKKSKEWENNVVNHEDEMNCGAVGCFSGDPKNVNN